MYQFIFQRALILKHKWQSGFILGYCKYNLDLYLQKFYKSRLAVTDHET